MNSHLICSKRDLWTPKAGAEKEIGKGNHSKKADGSKNTENTIPTVVLMRQWAQEKKNQRRIFQPALCIQRSAVSDTTPQNPGQYRNGKHQQVMYQVLCFGCRFSE